MRWLAAVWLMWVGDAHAFEVSLCGVYNTAFAEFGNADGDGVDANGDTIVNNDVADFVTVQAPQPLRGAYLWGQVLEPGGVWSTRYMGYADATGPNAGCTDVFETVDDGTGQHQVRLLAWTLFEVDGNFLSVYDDNATPDLGFVQTAPLVVTSSGTFVLGTGQGDDRWDNGIIGAFGLAREDGGVTGMQLDVFACAFPTGGGACTFGQPGASAYIHGSKRLFVGSQIARVVLHELGHAITAAKMPNQNQPWTMTYGWINEATDPALDSVCEINSPSNHQRNSDEATSAAIVEGFADYYAAVVLNRTDEADCFAYSPPRDWDHSGGVDGQGSNWVSCEQRPTMLNELDNAIPTTMNRDYWLEECQQSVTSVASEYDWERGLWDLDTDRGYTFTELADIFAEANPDTWLRYPNPMHTVPGPIGGGVFQSCPSDFDPAALDTCPYVRMGLDPNGNIRAGWSQECDNGICR